MIYNINCVILQWITLILLILRVSCSGQGSSEEIQTDEEAETFDIDDMLPDHFENKPDTPEKLENLFNTASEKLEKDGILKFVLDRLEERTSVNNTKYIRYVRLIGPGSVVPHKDHYFYYEEGWNHFNSFSGTDQKFQHLRHYASSAYQIALMIEIVKHFNELQKKKYKHKKSIEATIEDLHLDPNEIKYYKERKDIKINPIKVEMPNFTDWLQQNKTNQQSTLKNLKKKQSTKGQASSSSSSNIPENKGGKKEIWKGEEWVNWIKNAPNNLNTIPGEFVKMEKNEITLIMLFGSYATIVNELFKSYIKLNLKKHQLIIIASSFDDYNEPDFYDNYRKLFGNNHNNFISFLKTNLSKFFGEETKIYYKP
ncbi:hypothetical protein Mgra_00010234 [Meloidogyne graminicola]|uniref:Uncharacterized protein n=1 Tax=Meloidogyne graminicola TaxID=189291 RepID=A0A8S9ZB64_9BILA|nr:hypothetical protein Mgra_00010234 [Meloidogyne graminicola]